MTFVRKVCSAIAVFFISALIDFGGYLRPVDGVEQVQPFSVILTIRLIVVLAPLLFLSIGITAARRYPLTEKTHNRLRKFMDEKAKAEPLNASLAEEEKELRRILV
jgi:Na+/melibiose symporter-like transporter